MSNIAHDAGAAVGPVAVEHRTLPSPFDSPEGEAAYLAAYDATMQLWPVAFEPLDIASRFGRTHVVVSGPADAPPLVLLHGFGGALTMWWPNVADFCRHYRVYAVDVIGQAGRSIPDQPITSRADYVEWLTALLDALGIEETHMVGMSYGGWLTLNYAIGAPERVIKLALLSPAGSFVPLVDEFYERAMRMTASPTRSLTDGFMQWLASADTPRDAAIRAGYKRLMEQFYLGVAHFRGVPNDAVVPPGVFADDELRSLRVPTLMLVGDRDPIYDPAAALARASLLLPSFEGALVPESGHMMCFSRAALVDARVLEFLKDDRSIASRIARSTEAVLPG